MGVGRDTKHIRHRIVCTRGVYLNMGIGLDTKRIMYRIVLVEVCPYYPAPPQEVTPLKLPNYTIVSVGESMSLQKSVQDRDTEV